MKANYATGHGLGWLEPAVHHNNCKECRFNNGCSDKLGRYSERCMKFKPKSFKRKKRSKKK